MSSDEQMDKPAWVHSHNGKRFINKNVGTIYTCNRDQSQMHYVKWKKPL